MNEETRKYPCYASERTFIYRIKKEEFKEIFMLSNSKTTHNFRSNTEIREAFFLKSANDTEMIYDKMRLEIQKEEDSTPLKKLRRIINSEKFKRKFMSHFYYGGENKNKRKKNKFFKRKVNFSNIN